MSERTQGAYIFGCTGTELTANERDFFREADPFGFILFARNIDTPDQVIALTAALRDAVGREAPILIDQEGGRVQRLQAPHWHEWLPALDQMEQAGPAKAGRAMYIRSRLIAAELREVGIDGNCSPLGDIARVDTHPVLKNRCYGYGPETVTSAARAVADGLLDGGVLPVMKHMPGHGLSTLDTHLELPKVDADLERLKQADFVPFQALCELPMGMTAHIVFSEIDPDHPATQSGIVIDLIRQQIGFDGLLMTDDLSMHALEGDMTDRTRKALDAGCDVVLHCHAVMSEMEDVVATAGRLSGKGAERATSALSARRTPDPIDAHGLHAELAAILREGVHV
ncbi:beta-N-acetylhexosaminidase [Qingshengfaniella alkalisoli]|uniref:beta-N-acetylhexosaminidase n=1 Tax=Qingshengfaniella alkalisoli TaxID=2599296 RepID=A0A5B8I915_9RHOB|nr:beta-N-acetylhexosaminidase [Qingshengfaniella alkalisoli]QDY69356.1 beta-N-acetylhexosaminidase [Qingshengfaniella alkalisoli]